MKTIPQLLKDYREACKFSFEECEKHCQKTISASFWWEIENGKWLPSKATLTKFCEKTGQDIVLYLGALEYSKMLRKIIK